MKQLRQSKAPRSIILTLACACGLAMLSPWILLSGTIVPADANIEHLLRDLLVADNNKNEATPNLRHPTTVVPVNLPAADDWTESSAVPTKNKAALREECSKLFEHLATMDPKARLVFRDDTQEALAVECIAFDKKFARLNRPTKRPAAAGSKKTAVAEPKSSITSPQHDAKSTRAANKQADSGQTSSPGHLRVPNAKENKSDGSAAKDEKTLREQCSKLFKALAAGDHISGLVMKDEQQEALAIQCLERDRARQDQKKQFQSSNGEPPHANQAKDPTSLKKSGTAPIATEKEKILLSPVSNGKPVITKDPTRQAKSDIKATVAENKKKLKSSVRNGKPPHADHKLGEAVITKHPTRNGKSATKHNLKKTHATATKDATKTSDAATIAADDEKALHVQCAKLFQDAAAAGHPGSGFVFKDDKHQALATLCLRKQREPLIEAKERKRAAKLASSPRETADKKEHAASTKNVDQVKPQGETTEEDTFLHQSCADLFKELSSMDGGVSFTDERKRARTITCLGILNKTKRVSMFGLG